MSPNTEHSEDRHGGTSGRWFEVCPVEDVKPGAATVVAVVPPVAVFNVDGELLATDDTCSHSTSSLADEGYIDGATVECGYHFATFCLRTGAVLKAPASRPLRVWPVEVRSGVVYVDLGLHPSTLNTLAAAESADR